MSPVTCSPFSILPLLHPPDYWRPLHSVTCREKLQLRGPCSMGMGREQCHGWDNCLGIPWIQ